MNRKKGGEVAGAPAGEWQAALCAPAGLRRSRTGNAELESGQTLAHEPKRLLALLGREIFACAVEPGIAASGMFGEHVPGRGFHEIGRHSPACDIEARQAVLRYRVAARRRPLEDSRGSRLILDNTIAVEQHDGVFDFGRLIEVA